MREAFRKWAGVLVAAAVAATAGTVHAQGKEKVSVVLDFLPWGIHGPMHLAKAKGWFDQAGLDVDIADGKGTLSGLQLVGAGRVDVAAVQLGPMAVARESGLDLLAIAGYARRGDLAIIVDEKTGPKNAKELAGKKLVCFTGSPWVPFIETFGRNAGIGDQFKVTMVAAPAMVSSYASGDADGFLSLAPFGVPLVAKSRPGRAILAADHGIHFPSYGLVVTNDTLKKRRDAMKKMVDVQTRAWEYIYRDGNFDEAVKAIIAARPDAKLDPELLKGQMMAYRDFIETPATKGKRWGWQAEQDWMEAIKSMETAGAIKPGRKPSEYYTNALVE
jgi:NitT/TauT family transport system substrate-binding protein